MGVPDSIDTSPKETAVPNEKIWFFAHSSFIAIVVNFSSQTIFNCVFNCQSGNFTEFLPSDGSND